MWLPSWGRDCIAKVGSLSMRSCRLGVTAAWSQARHDRSGSVPTLGRTGTVVKIFFLLVKKWINPGDIIDSSQIYVDENEWRNEWSTCRAFWCGQLLTLVRSSRRLGGLVPMKSHAPRLELPILRFSDGFYRGMPDSNQKMVRRSFKKCSCRQGNMLGIWRTATNNNSQSWLEHAKPRGILKASQMFSWQRHVEFHAGCCHYYSFRAPLQHLKWFPHCRSIVLGNA